MRDFFTGFFTMLPAANCAAGKMDEMNELEGGKKNNWKRKEKRRGKMGRGEGNAERTFSGIGIGGGGGI